MRNFYVILIFLSTVFSATCAYPAMSPCRTADDVFSFAQSLEKDSDYDSAVSEFKRFVFFFPNDQKVPEALFSAGMARFNQHRYSDAIALFASVEEKYGTSDTAIESVFMISRCLVAAQETESAILILKRLSSSLFDQSVHDRALVQTGWLYLQKSGRKFNIDAAKKAFSAVSDSGKKAFHIQAILHELDAKGKNIPKKSPFLAGLFSIVPGGGYLYCGRYRDAGMAFFLNSVLFTAAYESFDKRLYTLGGMLGAVGVGFYGGSIYGGITSAHKYNARAKGRFLNGLKQKYAPADVSLSRQRGGFFVAFSLKF
ncbi:MAG: tetratricopeptide repeat protein [Deltaproteobacteria bacterium]|nr:tetratricopeptide repeat protein [Deltaproteobacteria bacterium]